MTAPAYGRRCSAQGRAVPAFGRPCSAQRRPYGPAPQHHGQCLPALSAPWPALVGCTPLRLSFSDIGEAVEYESHFAEDAPDSPIDAPASVVDVDDLASLFSLDDGQMNEDIDNTDSSLLRQFEHDYHLFEDTFDVLHYSPAGDAPVDDESLAHILPDIELLNDLERCAAGIPNHAMPRVQTRRRR